MGGVRKIVVSLGGTNWNEPVSPANFLPRRNYSYRGGITCFFDSPCTEKDRFVAERLFAFWINQRFTRAVKLPRRNFAVSKSADIGETACADIDPSVLGGDNSGGSIEAILFDD